ncbi:hypothetical protein Cgig2_027177 [Carnegiea gigantea]|uniref:Reverse transcriptase domain-containing protein n=1 Tax=Carnegiea gigantea TaxID=171969 RepID=A0A9Q1QR12_9CARY|nr:hypothetical protein Cgig2_027177 [Carnegiea gigantea]
MEAANSARPFPNFDYIPTHGSKPSHWLERIPSPHYKEQEREVSRSDRSDRPYTEPPPMTVPPKPQNVRKCCEFHEQSGHTTTKCRELKKALRKLADKGMIDRFLKRGSRRNNSVSLKNSAQKCTISAYHGAMNPHNSTHNCIWQNESSTIRLPHKTPRLLR